MQELFEILHLSENSSKEDMKSAFLAWKKKQQQILSHGNREEQKTVTDSITRMTSLYKQFMGNSGQYDKTSETSKTKTDVVQIKTTVTGVNRQVKGDTRNKSNEKVIHDTPVMNATENTANKSMVAVLMVVIVSLCGVVLYLLNDKKNIRMSTVNVETPFKSTESSIFSGRLISALENSIQEIRENNNKPKPTENVKNNELQRRNNESEIKSGVNEKPSKEIDKNTGKTEAQRAAEQTLLDFHENITKKNFSQAYSCLSRGFQNYMSYEGWVPGFKTTVSSEVSDIKILSETSNTVVLTYILKSVDNIGGKQEVLYFSGTASVINENGSWKIDEVTNKVR